MPISIADNLYPVHTTMMISLFLSLALLGLSAIDPIGIAAMPILLLQKHPYRRSLIFIGGSFASLMVMGFVFSRGFGATFLRLEKSHPLIAPRVELLAGILLLLIAASILWRIKNGKFQTDPPVSITQRLKLGYGLLFLTGALLVVVQSILDVVFVLAMIKIGQLNLNTPTLAAAVSTYAFMALVLQLAVVMAYRIAPIKQRSIILDKTHSLLYKYASHAIFTISMILGIILIVMSV